MQTTTSFYTHTTTLSSLIVIVIDSTRWFIFQRLAFFSARRGQRIRVHWLTGSPWSLQKPLHTFTTEYARTTSCYSTHTYACDATQHRTTSLDCFARRVPPILERERERVLGSLPSHI
mmetsp:Transcript_5467/g.14823  ORF Transcript_5467/g.14823 Transcript_5467/m.14823 type:complete len:118 (+) Transcript_5467:108-461(+)